MARVITYSEARQNLASVCNEVNNDYDEVVVTRIGHPSVVIMSLDEFEALREMRHLTSSPANARKISEAIARLYKGEGVERELVEE